MRAVEYWTLLLTWREGMFIQEATLQDQERSYQLFFASRLRLNREAAAINALAVRLIPLGEDYGHLYRKYARKRDKK